MLAALAARADGAAAAEAELTAAEERTVALSAAFEEQREAALAALEGERRERSGLEQLRRDLDGAAAAQRAELDDARRGVDAAREAEHHARAAALEAGAEAQQLMHEV